MWPAKRTSPSLDMNNGVGNILETPSYYYKASPWSSLTPIIQQDVSTAYASSLDLIDINDMVLEKNNQMSWSSDELSLELSSSFNYPSYPASSSHSGGFHDSLSSPVNEQKASKFPEQQFSDFIISDIEKYLREANFGSNIWKYDSGKLNLDSMKETILFVN